MLGIYLLIAVIVFLVFVVKYVYQKFYVGGDSCTTTEDKLLIAHDLLKRLAAAIIWLPIGIYYIFVFRQEIAELYRKLLGKGC